MPSFGSSFPEASHAPSRSAPRRTPSTTSQTSTTGGGPATALRRKPSAGILTTSTTPSGARTARITTTTATTTTPPNTHPRPPSASSSASAPHPDRHPLRLRDQNVTSTRRPLRPDLGSGLAPIVTTRMPLDKQAAAAAVRPPAMPTVARGVNKPPLTPKIATRPPTAVQHHQNPPIATPAAARRAGPRSELAAREKEEPASPASGLLSHNITPRSGLRQLRVDSPSSTPAGTPTLERHDTWDSRSGLGIAASASTVDDATRRPVVTFAFTADASASARQDSDSKFFYASDAPKPSPKPVLQKSATFFYANGQTVPPRGSVPHVSPVPVLASPSMSQESAAGKFVYANGQPDLPASPRPGPPPTTTASSVVSTSSRLPMSRPASVVALPPVSSSTRPLSPVKLSPYPVAKPPSSSASPLPRSPASAASIPASLPFQQAAHPGRGHVRTESMTSNLTIAESPAVARIMSAHTEASSSPSVLAPAAIFPASPTITGFASLLQVAEDFASEGETHPESLNSPTKSPSQEKELTDLVSSARRERKVQDLEITNASLEAINRTLERQLRKQTAELRRYRRLSRSGRLSLNSAGSRVASGSSVDGGALARAGMGLDDLSEEESEMEAQDEDIEDEEDDFSGSESTGDLNSSTAKLRDASHRQRDEMRLQLDLSKHQQLLIDSQKINQSLKRCLGWTEELIKEGKRALEYKVRVSEVELGGRVLAPEDIEAREAREAEVLDEEDDDDVAGDDEDATLKITPWGKDAQDRDSGIELPADGG